MRQSLLVLMSFFCLQGCLDQTQEKQLIFPEISLGKSKDKIDWGDYYSYDYDIFVRKSQARHTPNEKDEIRLNQTTSDPGYPSFLNGTTIKIKITDSSVTPGEKNELEEAIATLNSVPCFGISFQLVRAGSWDIDIEKQGIPTESGTYDNCNGATFHDNGQPGNSLGTEIWFGPDVYSSAGPDHLEELFIHELLHCIGVGHTDDDVNDYHFPGTPVEDNNSIMNGGCSCADCPGTAQLSQYDECLLVNMYPENSTCQYACPGTGIKL